MSGSTTLHLATSIQSLTCHYILLKKLLDLPLCTFDAAETLFRRVLTPVPLRTFPELQETDAEDMQRIKVLVRRVVDLQSKIESVRPALQAEVKSYQQVLDKVNVN